MSGRRALPRRGSGDEAESRLRVDPVACEGIGMCAHLASRLIGLDSWGYPVVPQRPLSRPDLRGARAAVAGCPRQALTLQRSAPGTDVRR